MKVVVLGSGTSTGTPVPSCTCEVCRSENPRNTRLRPSIALQCFSAEGITPVTIVIDTGTDFRFQALRAGLSQIHGVIYTHGHADHTFGIDDLRGFNFTMGRPINAFVDDFTRARLETSFAYIFKKDPGYEGASPPQILLNSIRPFEKFLIEGIPILPLRLFHGREEILGFRIGDFAYLTDCSRIPEETYPHLNGLELLILDGLRMRSSKTHFTLEEAVREAEKIKARQTYLTHVAHEVDHEEGNHYLKSAAAVPVELAYDGLSIDVKDPLTQV